MTQQQLLQSLNTEQGAALNRILEESFTLRSAGEDASALKASLAEMSVQLHEAKAAKDAAFSEKEAAERALAQAKAAALSGLGKIKAAVLDPKTETDPAVLAIVHEETKDERTKQREAKLAQIATLQAEADSLQ